MHLLEPPKAIHLSSSTKLYRKKSKIPCFFFHNHPHRFFSPGCPGGIESRFLSKNKHFFRPPKGGEIMAVFRIEKTSDYTVMSNHHLRNAELSLKSKGLLSLILSLQRTPPGAWLKSARRVRTASVPLWMNGRVPSTSHICLQEIAVHDWWRESF